MTMPALAFPKTGAAVPASQSRRVGWALPLVVLLLVIAANAGMGWYSRAALIQVQAGLPTEAMALHGDLGDLLQDVARLAERLDGVEGDWSPPARNRVVIAADRAATHATRLRADHAARLPADYASAADLLDRALGLLADPSDNPAMALGAVSAARERLAYVQSTLASIYVRVNHEALTRLNAEALRLADFRHDLILAQLLFGAASLALIGFALWQRRAAILQQIAERRAASAEVRLREAIDSMTEGFALFDAQGRLVLTNQRFRALWQERGYRAAAGSPYLELLEAEVGRLPDAVRNQADLWAERRVASLGGHDNPVEIETADGHVLRIREFRTADGGLLRLDGDVTERRQAEATQRLSAAVFDIANEGIFITDNQNRIEAANPAFLALTGYSLDEIRGKDPRVLASGRHDPGFFAGMWRDLFRTGRWAGEVWDRRKDGAFFAAWLSIAGIRGAKGAVDHYCAILHDITSRKEDEERIWRQANFDALTGLPNRSLFMDRLSQALIKADREKWLVALIYIDLDKFKPVNDTYGHAAGDDLLQQAAARMAAKLRKSDTVARLGGDEFAVLLPNVDTPDHVLRIAGDILAALGEPFTVLGNPVQIGGSLGAALYPVQATGMEDLLHKADQAMYAVKQAGRNAVRLYDQA